MNLRIVFMGTPEFAVATLGAMLMNGMNVVAVVTAPDKEAGRGRKVQQSPVKQFAESAKIPVLQPVKLKDPDFLKQLNDLRADVFVVVAFRMLPREVWEMPPKGTINLHASLLPYYRGAAPINHAIINGETITGLTTFFINEEIDTGSILLREEVNIFPEENAGDLHDRLMKLGARLMIRTLRDIAGGNIRPEPQSLFEKQGKEFPSAPRIFPEFCYIDWKKEPSEIHNFIRGLSPLPGARTTIECADKILLIRILECSPLYEKHKYHPGFIISDGKEYMKIACNNGYINIRVLQAEGRKRMQIKDFLNGFNLGVCKNTLT